MAEETAQMKLARESADQRGQIDVPDWPRDPFGTPMVRIACAQSELIPTAQYANITLGPVQVIRFVADAGDEQIAAHIRETQKLCENAIAEDRETLHAQLRARAAGK